MARPSQILHESTPRIHPRVFAAAGFAVAAGLAFASGASSASGPENDTARVAVRPRVAAKRATPAPNTIRLDVKLILIPVTVTDPFGAPFSGLTRQAFRVFEGGVEQEVKYFARDDAPISLGVVFDASRSMDGKLEESRAAVGQFFKTAMPGDEFFLVEFSDSPRLLCNFTQDTEQIEKSLMDVEPKNWTSLLDAVYMAVQQMKRAKNPRKALLIVSDGADNASRYTESEIKAVVREADVCIYSIGIAGWGLFKRHVGLLRKLSEETGGRLQEVGRVSELPEAAAKISAAIRNQYLLGYSSNDRSNSGLYRKVEVRLNQPPDLPRLRASWRSGYYAPAGN